MGFEKRSDRIFLGKLFRLDFSEERVGAFPRVAAESPKAAAMTRVRDSGPGAHKQGK